MPTEPSGPRKKPGLFGRLAPGLKKLARKAKKVVLTQARPYLQPPHRPHRPPQPPQQTWQQPQGGDAEGYYGQPPPPPSEGQEWGRPPPPPPQVQAIANLIEVNLPSATRGSLE